MLRTSPKPRHVTLYHGAALANYKSIRIHPRSIDRGVADYQIKSHQEIGGNKQASCTHSVDSVEETMKQMSTGFIQKPTAVAVHRAYKALHPNRNYAVITNEVGTYDVMQIESGDLCFYGEMHRAIGRG